MIKPAMNHYLVSYRLFYKSLCGRMYVDGICDPGTIRGITCKNCRKAWAAKRKAKSMMARVGVL